MTMRSWGWLTCIGLAAAFSSDGAGLEGSSITAIMADARVKSALAAVRAGEPRALEEMVRFCEVPAPPFLEVARAEVLKQAFQGAGLRNVRIDKVGNVLGDRPGAGPRPLLVVAAHLDTVFPEGTPLQVSRDGQLFKGPGIGDNCRGLAVLVATARAMRDAGVQTPGSVTFVANVGEEGLGDLRGVKALVNEAMKDQVDRFVSVDGSGYGITHISVGSLRYRVTFAGPGGHSYGAFGIANPVHALGRAIEGLADIRPPAEPRTTFNVGRIGGGTSVNSISADAWMEVDMRSANPEALRDLDGKFHAAVDAALTAENARWNQRGRLTVTKTLVGDRPAGAVGAASDIVQRAVSVTRALGLPIELTEGSTDANAPMSLGIPAITVDAGGVGTGAHTLDETFDTTDSWRGTQRTLLIAIALSE